MQFKRGRTMKIGSRRWAWFIDREHCGVAATMDLALTDALSAAAAMGRTTEEKCRAATLEDLN